MISDALKRGKFGDKETVGKQRRPGKHGCRD